MAARAGALVVGGLGIAVRIAIAQRDRRKGPAVRVGRVVDAAVEAAAAAVLRGHCQARGHAPLRRRKARAAAGVALVAWILTPPEDPYAVALTS